jgi:3-oxoacyl-[acyl-carrier protein] reductase
MNVDLSNRIALVTGSTRGIGEAIADALEKAGARVWRHGTGPNRDQQHYVQGDFTREGDVQ